MKVMSEYFIRFGPPTSWVSKCLLTGNPEKKWWKLGQFWTRTTVKSSIRTLVGTADFLYFGSSYFRYLFRTLSTISVVRTDVKTECSRMFANVRTWNRTNRARELQTYWNSSGLLLATLNKDDQCKFCCVRSFHRFDLFKVQKLKF